MLYSIETNAYVWTIPHREDYDIWRSRITDTEHKAIVSALVDKIEGEEIHTPDWIPEAGWQDTVFEPIYTKACRQDEAAARKFFGLLLWGIMLEHEEVWSFGRYKWEGIQVDGVTYFKLGRAP